MILSDEASKFGKERRKGYGRGYDRQTNAIHSMADYNSDGQVPDNGRSKGNE